MINRRLQNFYHKQKKGLFAVLLVFLITFFQLKQVSSTTLAYGATRQSTNFPVSPIPVSSTPTYTPTVTPTSTPVPTLPIHKFPVITTTSLPKGSLLKNYLAYVEGYDEDSNLNLTMKITGLPPGLSSKVCGTWIDGLNRKNIRCQISGKPLKMGSYNVNVDLYDNLSGQVKILKLTIGLR